MIDCIQQLTVLLVCGTYRFFYVENIINSVILCCLSVSRGSEEGQGLPGVC